MICRGWNSSDGIFLCGKSIEGGTHCHECFSKVSFIRKMPNGRYRVLSEKGKNLGESSSREKARARLKQVEYFKHLSKQRKRRRRKRALMFLTLIKN